MEFQSVIWMWEFQPIEKEKHAKDREERSLQQFCINNIGHRPAIWVENKDIIHTHSSCRATYIWLWVRQVQASKCQRFSWSNHAPC